MPFRMLFQSVIFIPFFLMAYNFVANLANDIYLPSLPLLVNVFSTTHGAIQFTMTAWFAGVALPQLIFGPLTDKVGRLPVLFLGGICFLISSLVCGLATHVSVLIIARFFQGVGVCSLNVTSFAILSDLYPYYQRMRLTNKMSMIGTASPIVGPIIGGYVLSYCGWRANFFLIFCLAGICLVGLKLCLLETNIRLNKDALRWRVLCRNYYALVKTTGFLQHLLPYCLLLGGLVAFLMAAPFVIIESLHYSPSHFGFTQLPIFFAYIVGGMMVNYAKEGQIKKLIPLGLTTVSISMFIMIVTGVFFPNSLTAFILPMMGYCLGFSCCASALVTEVMSLVNENRGYASAMLGFGMALSCTLMSAILSVFFKGSSLSLALLLFSIAILASILYNLHSRTNQQAEGL